MPARFRRAGAAREVPLRGESLSWVVRGAGLALGVGLVLVLAGIVAAARDVVLLVFLAVLLGAALEPLIGTMRGRAGVPRGVAILIVYAGFLAGVVAIAVFIVPAALVQLSSALSQLPRFLEQVRAWGENLRPGALGDGIGALVDAIKAPFEPGPPPDPKSVVNASILVGQAAGALITLLFLVFFWLTERPRLQRYVLAFAPASRRGGIRDAWNEVEARLGLWARGQLVLMATIGVATGIAYSLLGLPAALLLGLIAAVMEVIPIVGPLLGAIPAVLVATTISPQTVVLTLAIYFVLQLVEGNLLVPMIMRNSVGLSPFLVLVSLLVGGTVGGPLGAIVAVPVVAGITVILERLQDRDTPVPVDPAAVETPDEEDKERLRETSPSAPKRRRRRSSDGISRA
jgi:putative heme transporter